MDGMEDEIQKITNNYSLKINMKKLGIALLVLFVGLFPCALIAHSENDLVNKAIDNGIGLGSVLAIVASVTTEFKPGITRPQFLKSH